MMREIKFRGKRVDNGDWVTGDLLQIEEDCRIWDYDITDNGVSDTLRLYEIWHNVDPATIGQYTGRNVKGVPVFQDDIGKNIDGVFLVVWDNEKSAYMMNFYSYPNEQLYLEEMWDDTEIIGNIHDNPGLLEEFIQFIRRPKRKGVE